MKQNMIEKLDLEKFKLYVTEHNYRYNGTKFVEVAVGKLNEIIEELNILETK